MEIKENTHFIDKVIDKMRNAADELEAFQLQANLGKMEALEKYDELKKTFSIYLHEAKLMAIRGNNQIHSLEGKFQNLQLQFALGKAETKETFEEQKKKILLAIHEIQVEIKTNPTFIKVYAELLNALENLKLKLEIISENLNPMKQSLKDGFDVRKKQVEEAISNFKDKFEAKTHLDEKLDILQDEMSLAYKHFKKAFIQS
jgi:predicted phosphodiesterase